jgi:methyl-accepting chemotaxis protein
MMSVTRVTDITDIMGEIASASDEQSRGIDQVGLAVTEMDRVTQQNGALYQHRAGIDAADRIFNQTFDLFSGLRAALCQARASPTSWAKSPRRRMSRAAGSIRSVWP